LGYCYGELKTRLAGADEGAALIDVTLDAAFGLTVTVA